MVAFGKMAEIIGQYCRSGHRLWIEGKLETSKYTDPEGITRYSTQIIINDLIFLNSADKNQGMDSNNAPLLSHTRHSLRSIRRHDAG